MSKLMVQKTGAVQAIAKQSNSGPGKQRGFTLIEIAIVLVIIGLLLGGVLKGQELINTARVRALNNNVDGITAAWFSFQDRYRAFPGDYSQASVNLPGAPTDGDGNGLVDTDGERANVWVQLQAAGYITGNFDGANVVDDQYGCPVASCPDNGFGSGMNLSYGAEIASATATTADAHELISGRGIPVEVIAELDRKVDDGAPQTGAMQLGTDGTNWSGSAGCETGTAPNTVYQLQQPSADCAAVFRNF